jgi:RNA polymerase-binding transcription factor DksA
MPSKKKTTRKKVPVKKAMPKKKAVRKAVKKKVAAKKKAITKKKVAPKKKATAGKKVAPKKKATAGKKVAPKTKATTKKEVIPKKKKTTRKKMTLRQLADRKAARLQADREAAAVRVKAVAAAAAAKKKKLATTNNKKLKLAPFVRKQQQKLLALRDELIGQMSGMAKDTLRSPSDSGDSSAFGMHQADAGSDSYDRDFALNLLSQEQDAFHEIEEALARIQKGVYGICEMSGEKILQARLQAIPFARYTVGCQEQLEKQEEPGKVRQPVGPLFGSSDMEGALADGSSANDD